MHDEPTYRRWLALEGDFFEKIIALIYEACVKAGDHVVDVGANHGLHTIPLAKRVGLSGRVIAIEALPHLAKALRKATTHLGQVRVVNKAIAARPGDTPFVWVKKSEGLSGLLQRDLPPEWSEDLSTIRVRASTLDQTARQGWFSNRRFSFVKMDIEGGEYDALRGARAILTDDRPVVVFENGGPKAANLYGYTRDDFFALFDAAAYDIYDLFGRRLTPNIWDSDQMPWYSVASPKGSASSTFIDEHLSAHIARLEMH